MMRYLRLFASFVLVELFKPVNRMAGYLTKWSRWLIEFGQRVHPAGPPAEIDSQLSILCWAVDSLDGHTFVRGELIYMLDNGNTVPLRLVPDLHKGVRIDWSETRREDLRAVERQHDHE